MEENVEENDDLISIFYRPGQILSDDESDICAYTAVDDDFLLPKGVYKTEKGVLH